MKRLLLVLAVSGLFGAMMAGCHAAGSVGENAGGQLSMR